MCHSISYDHLYFFFRNSFKSSFSRLSLYLCLSFISNSFELSFLLSVCLSFERNAQQFVCGLRSNFDLRIMNSEKQLAKTLKNKTSSKLRNSFSKSQKNLQKQRWQFKFNERLFDTCKSRPKMMTNHFQNTNGEV